jgi:hypothetical protein
VVTAVTGNDVVQLLVENYTGAKKLQVGLFGRCIGCFGGFLMLFESQRDLPQ